jgi:hypothetical protein
MTCSEKRPLNGHERNGAAREFNTGFHVAGARSGQGLARLFKPSTLSLRPTVGGTEEAETCSLHSLFPSPVLCHWPETLWRPTNLRPSTISLHLSAFIPQPSTRYLRPTRSAGDLPGPGLWISCGLSSVIDQEAPHFEYPTYELRPTGRAKVLQETCTLDSMPPLTGPARGARGPCQPSKRKLRPTTSAIEPPDT